MVQAVAKKQTSPNPIALAIHRFLEWKLPGETSQHIARRGLAHYNCAVSIANLSLIACVSIVALIIFRWINPFLGLMFFGMARYVHCTTTRHLHAMTPYLEDLTLSFIRRLSSAPATQHSPIADKLAKQARPTHLFNVTSWFRYISINFPLSQN